MVNNNGLPAGDVLALVGVVLIAVGLALWSVPLAVVATGAVFLAGGLWSHFHDPRPPVPPAG